MDDDLIARAQHGDQQAFEGLVDRYADIAWRTAWVLLADRTRAEDALQEAWLDLWRNLGRYGPDRPFRPWLLRIVANRCRSQARRLTLPSVSLDAHPGVLDNHSASVDDVAQTYLRREVDAELHAAFAALTPEQRQIVQLRFFADLELHEIAEVLSVPLGTVKSRLHRALATLRQHLPDHEPVRGIAHE
jgi:RNA polymerase sigma-70 factor (ECF subfamily)